MSGIEPLRRNVKDAAPRPAEKASRSRAALHLVKPANELETLYARWYKG
jgi:hypothetical protein